MTKITWKAEKRNLEDLIHWEENPRTISKANFERLKEKIQARGFHDVIKIDTENRILSGNMRKDALVEMGITEVNVLVPSRKLTVEEMIRIGLESNISEGEWDDDKLFGFGEDILSDVGFSDKDITGIFDKRKTKDDDLDLDDALSKAKKTKVKMGDIYQLGAHTLMCGDATNSLDVAKLMAGKKADMVFTDPPYNVDYQGGGNYAEHKTPKREKIENDKMSDGEFHLFLEKSVSNMLEHCTGIFYICMSSKELASLKDVFEKNGGHWQSFIIWVKNTFTLSRSDWQNQYEPILYGWNDKNKKHYFQGFRDEGNVWENLDRLKCTYDGDHTMIKVGNYHIKIKGKAEGEVCRKNESVDIWYEKKPNKSTEHPTMKPIALVTKAIKASSKLGEKVLDTFVGSGTTLIASEQTGRVCYAMEMSPQYVQVVIDRWEALTGKKAEKI